MAGEPGQGIIAMATDQLSPLLNLSMLDRGKGGDNFAVSRIVLHRLLTTGVEDVIRYGHRFDRVEALESGKVRVHFTDGASTERDNLVAEDGGILATCKILPP